MKKIALLMFTLLLFSLCACSNTPEATVSETPVAVETGSKETAAAEISEPEPETEPTVPEPDLPTVEFSQLMQTASAEHKAMVEGKAALDSIRQYQVVEPGAADLLTQEEIRELLTYESFPATITYEEAVYDVDILFRAFRSAYGGYHYFGDGAFRKAQDEIMDWLEGQDVVATIAFEQVASDAFSFLRDAHGSVGNRRYEKDLRWEYFYTDQYFAQDSDGYYQYRGGEKWYLESFADSAVKIEPSLTGDGELLYSPVLFCTLAEMKDSTMTLKNTAGQKQEVALNWILSEPFAQSYHTPDYKLLEENGIAYLSIRCFDHQYKDRELAQFVASGKEVKDAELIIFDIRANGGGGDEFAAQWVKNFCGTSPQYTIAFTNQVSRLHNAWLADNGFATESGKPGVYREYLAVGKQIPNRIPIIVLVDDACGSSGESMLNDLRCLDNVLIVGSNSAGYQLCGNQMSMCLPHSNIPFSFGASLEFAFTDENVDFKGYEPDVWCNPKTAFPAVLAMLERCGLAEESTVAALREKKAYLPGVLTLQWGNSSIYSGVQFGADKGTHYLQVYLNGNPVRDFTVTGGADWVTITRERFGFIEVKVLREGTGQDCPFTVTAGNNTATFYWFGG